MQYLGGKSRLGAKIVSEILFRAPETVGFVEPFMGGAGISLHLSAQRPTICGDLFAGLANMHAAAVDGFRFPEAACTDLEYAELKRLSALGNRSPIVVATGFGLSFGGKYFGGLARPADRYQRHFNSGADKLAAQKKLVICREPRDFRDWRDLARPNITFYCDPPYASTEKYVTGTFDTLAFIQECLIWSRLGARVFVSEFDLPGFSPIAEFPRTVAVDNASGKPRKSCIDRLYEVK